MKCPWEEKMRSGEIVCDALYSEGRFAAPCKIKECPTEIFNQCQGCDSEFGKVCANQLIYHEKNILCVAAIKRGEIKSCPFFHLHNREIAKERCPDFIEGEVLVKKESNK